MDKISIIIPARIGSSRLHAKVLRHIFGKPVVVWVAEGASQSSLASEVIVATDDEEVMKVVSDAGFKARMTRKDHPSGTDRIWEVAKELDSDWILNAQGDEPLITGDVLDSLCGIVLGEGGAKHEIVTLVRKLDVSEIHDPNRVKAVIACDGRALYFSRSAVPYVREHPVDDADSHPPGEFFLHIGLYLYRRDILERFVGLPQSPLEMTERLEQLRALENGIGIHCVETEHEFLGVDTESDIPRVEEALKMRL